MDNNLGPSGCHDMLGSRLRFHSIVLAKDFASSLDGPPFPPHGPFYGPLGHCIVVWKNLQVVHSNQATIDSSICGKPGRCRGSSLRGWSLGKCEILLGAKLLGEENIILDPQLCPCSYLSRFKNNSHCSKQYRNFRHLLSSSPSMRRI